MSGWFEHIGVAVSLPIDNIDTDQLIPARFMSRPRTTGYGEYLLYDLRQSDNSVNYIMNRIPAASILVSGRNFGSGSSREAAVYALVDAGIKAVFSTSFGEIFVANATNNGLLAATVTQSVHDSLLDQLGESSEPVVVNLVERTITINQQKNPFQLDDAKATKLINGWDDIDLTKVHEDRIARYRERRQHDASWAWPCQSEG